MNTQNSGFDVLRRNVENSQTDYQWTAR